MKDTLVDKSTGGTAVGRGVITNAGVAKRDPVASAALSAYVRGKTFSTMQLPCAGIVDNISRDWQ